MGQCNFELYFIRKDVTENTEELISLNQFGVDF